MQLQRTSQLTDSEVHDAAGACEPGYHRGSANIGMTTCRCGQVPIPDPEPLTGDDLIRNLLDIAQKRAEAAQEKRFVLDPATWPTPHRHYNDVRVNDCGHDLHYGWLEIAQEIEDVQQLMDFVGIPDGLPQGKGDADWRVAVVVVRLMDAEARLSSIAAAHARETTGGGMVGDYCVECEHRWPCPTYRWANGDSNANESWERPDE